MSKSAVESAKPQIKEDDVTWGIIDNKEHPDFKKVYKKYQESFTLKTEQESRQNFEDILDDNKNPNKPGKEMWVYAKDKQTGEIVGANNFDVFKARPGHGVDVAAIDIYMFVDKNHRQQGMFTLLQKKTEEAAAQYAHSIDPSIPANTDKVITFAEQNHPLLMTPAEIIADSKSAFINQANRRIAFEQEGFRTLDMRYLQPSLESEAEAKKAGTIPETCDYLQTVAKVPKGMTAIPTAVIEGFYEDFFAKSFPEGTSLKMDALKGMRADIEASKTQGGITLADEGKFEQLKDAVSIEALSKLPKAQRNTILGELRPDLVEKFHGKGVTVDAVMDSDIAVRGQRAAASPDGKDPVQSLRAAMAAKDINAIRAAINNGAPVPNTSSFLKLAQENPALAGMPAVAALIAAQAQKQENPPAPVLPKEQTAETPAPAKPTAATNTKPAAITGNIPAAMKAALKQAQNLQNKGAVIGGTSVAAAGTRAENVDETKLPQGAAKNRGGII